MGMSQAWFIGPIGKKIGDPMFGGDVGFELAFAFSAISYFGFRTLEKKRFGR
jgi:purine-cytosine permease-like protein